jgi:hypothetical protein
MIEDDRRDVLAAEADDPWLTVHGLSEFAFCLRAGLCLYEQDFEDDESEPEADVYFLPIHEPRELELVLETLIRQFLWVAGGGLGAFALLALAAWFTGSGGVWLAAGVTFPVTAWGLYDRGYWVYAAQRQLALWQEATPRMPDAETPRIQEIDWRDLLASEATALQPPAAYQDADLRLGGKPWRVLEYGDLRIPVFKPRRPWKDLFPQHFVRMTAYCHLLEINEGARSPYGVIVKGETFAAVTVPNTPRTQAMFHEALRAARRTVREAEEINGRPHGPKDRGFCRECPFGWPVRLRPGEPYLRHGAPIALNVAKDRRETEYHSHCGDRFGWIPPHQMAEAMELVEE